MLGARAGGLVLFDGSPFRQNVVWWTGERGDEVEDMIAGVGRHKETVAIPSPYGQDVYVPLAVGGKTTGALVVRGASATRATLDSVGRLVALAIERERFIEERAHLQALEESDALRTSLLRAVSHDLTTPLTSISIRTESLKRGTSDRPDLAEAVDAIGTETLRLRRRIDNLLAMARLEAGRLVPRPEPTPPGDLFRAIRESVPPVFESRPVAVRVEAPCPDAFVDPSLALEIFVNLVENAHRASPPGAQLELVARRHPIEPDKIRFEVIDEGPGIAGLPLADAPANGATAESGDLPRRGLGLEIARSLTVASGGTLSIANRASGHGTVARVDLPACRLPEEEAS
jgi:two-component system sensor histidine kinase KdpD